jgi:hypothetical protein
MHYRTVTRIFRQYFFDVLVALAAIPADAETLEQFLAGTHTFVDGTANLPVGDRFANTDVHTEAHYLS